MVMLAAGSCQPAPTHQGSTMKLTGSPGLAPHALMAKALHLQHGRQPTTLT